MEHSYIILLLNIHMYNCVDLLVRPFRLLLFREGSHSYRQVSNIKNEEKWNEKRYQSSDPDFQTENGRSSSHTRHLP